MPSPHDRDDNDFAAKPVRHVKCLYDLKIPDIDFLELTEACEPVLLKGAAQGWPIVKAALSGNMQLSEYLHRFYSGDPLICYRAPASAGGVFSYNDSMTGFNFQTGQVRLHDVLDEILAASDKVEADALYIGSTDLKAFFPALSNDNPIGFIKENADDADIIGSIWIGNQTTAKAHFDISNNIACCVAGRRRFTLFPPDQIANLYPGPIEPTPGGQVISMVDFNAPDPHQFPFFDKAMAHSIVADMEPGDILVYPAMWWHHVEAQDPFNILINYWWNAVPAHIETPMNTLLHGMLSLRDRPDYEKSAWKSVFDYYLFGDADVPREHLPVYARGDLASMTDPVAARRLRAKLINRLNR